MIYLVLQAMVASTPAHKEEGKNSMPKQQTRAQQAAAVASNSGEHKQRPHHDEALKCPRCDSSNTKFCYYNNYSTTQPRYLCKACRRYWTQGGTLRSVPQGGNSRKNKRNSKASSSSTAAALSSSTTSSATRIITSSTQQLMMVTTPTPMMTMDFSGMLPTFMSTAAVGDSLEELTVPLPFAPLSLSSNSTPSGGATTASFLDMLGFLDDGNNSTSNGNEMAAMEDPLPPFDAMPMQLMGPLQGQGMSNASTGGLQQWSSAQHGSFNDGGFAAGSSMTGVRQQQQQQVGDHGGHEQEHKVALMDYWTNSNGASKGSDEPGPSGSSAAKTKFPWQ